jgi:membrane protease subunit (stomatin/prohibitin family)
MAKIPFTDNYVDLSSSRGFQFKFHCQKCGNGYISTFQTNTLSTVATAAQVVSTLFGGLLGRAAQSAQTIEQAVAGPQHDAALKSAVEEIAPTFKQCTRCGQWVCEPVCWNKEAQLCENCAPDLDEEISAAQAFAAREQAMQKAREVDYLANRNLEQVAAALCPSCGAKTQGGKFCPECGTSLNPKRTCGSCGTETEGSPKFCPECGTSYAP